MITIIHGDDASSSRNYFLSLKQKIESPFTIDAYKTLSEEIIQLLNSRTLFFDEKNIFIENFFSLKKSQELKKLISYIQNLSKKSDIYFWEGETLGKENLNVFKNSLEKLFKIPQKLFSFLDNIKPNNISSVTEFHNALTTSNEDILFYLIVRKFRLLISMQSEKDSIDELKRLAPWQRGKLKKQLSFFSEEKLKENYKKLYEIDLAYKSGNLLGSLLQAIDIFLLEL